MKSTCFIALIVNAYAFCNLPFSEGYEKLARAKEGIPLATDTSTSNQRLASVEASGNGAAADDFDMFADDNEHDTSKPSTDENNAVIQSSSDAINSGTEGKYIASLKWKFRY